MSTRSDTRLTRTQHALLVLAVVVCRLCASRCFPIYDDAFITYRHAQHMAEGVGLVYNPGAAWEPVLGTSTPFFAILLAGCARLGAGIVAAALVLDLVFDAITAVLLPRLLGGARLPSTLALVAFAALPQLVRISVGGMESPLFALCGVAASVALAAEIPVLAGVLAALACVVRPEGVLLCTVLILARLRRPEQLVRFVLPVAVIGIAAVVWLGSTYGTVIPQSVRAKATLHGEDAVGETFARWRTILQQSFAPAWGFVPLLPFVVHGAARSLAQAGALRLFSLWSLAISASYLLARPHTWGWYYYVALVAWTLWFGLGAERACAWIAPRLGAGFVRAARSFGPQALALVAMAAAGLASWKRPTPVDRNVYAPMREWASSTSAAEPGARLLAYDIGAIGWWWKGTLLDSAGLVWPDALRYPSPNGIIEAERPDYVMIVADRRSLERFQERPDLFAQYEAIARFSANGETKLDPSPDELSREWTQDYLVYRRRAP
jgi:hypothetical protein